MSGTSFEGTDQYVATDDLMMAVNAAVTLQRPLLIKGEPGTGKTHAGRGSRAGARAAAVRSGTSSPPPRPSRACTSTTRCRGCAIRSSATSGSRTSPTTSSRASCGRPSSREQQPVLLIDEIDKADIEFPNDLLRELDRMEFYVYETRQTVKARQRPIIIITSNNEKELPDAFLRRCFFHYIRFPDRGDDGEDRRRAFPGPEEGPADARRWSVFFDLREVPGLKKKPSTSELLDWIKLLVAEDIPPEALRSEDTHKIDPAAVRRAAEERAGRAPVRAAGVPATGAMLV